VRRAGARRRTAAEELNYDKAVQALCAEGVEFVIIGGWSAILHGSARITNDLDICFSRTRENLRRPAKALAPYHPRLRGLPEGLPFGRDEVTLHNGNIFTLTTDLGIIDLLAEVTGVGTFEEANTASITVSAFGVQVRTLDLKHLIKSKRAAGREKDLSALPELESLLEAGET
jgi:predicted nucleotidyltransferase